MTTTIGCRRCRWPFIVGPWAPVGADWRRGGVPLPGLRLWTTLVAWIEAVENASIPEVRTFASGPVEDSGPVLADVLEELADRAPDYVP